MQFRSTDVPWVPFSLKKHVLQSIIWYPILGYLKEWVFSILKSDPCNGYIERWGEASLSLVTSIVVTL